MTDSWDRLDRPEIGLKIYKNLIKNNKWKITYHKNAGSNIGEYKTDLKAIEYITKEEIHRFNCIIFKNLYTIEIKLI